MKLVILAYLALLGIVQTPATAQSLTYTTSWLGNSFGGSPAPGQPRKHVPLSIDGLFVLPDGTCYSNAGWDEDGCEVSFFKNGDVLGSASHTHGWGYGGGSEVAANNHFLFLTQSVGNEGGGLVAADTWPEKGLTWVGISRRKRDGSAAPFPGGLGGHGDTLRNSFLKIAETREGAAAEISGLAADNTHLYLSNFTSGEIAVYDPETLARLSSWPLQRPGRIAIAADGTLWIIQRGDAAHKPRILHRTADGKPLGKEITDIVSPTALCVDRSGRLLVADDSPAQQIRIYSTRSQAPKLVGTFGEAGGIFAGKGARIGQDGPLRFHHITGVGSDADGNIIVASDGAGTVLESYAPNRQRNWRLLGLEFIDTPEADPATDGREIYTKAEHITLDYLRTKPGSEWTYAGCTLNRFKYPDDPRLHTGATSAFVRRIQGKLFLFTTDMYADKLSIFRFDRAKTGEVAIPAGLFAKGHQKGDWPPFQPEIGEWIWRDVNGNGAMQAGEYLSRPTDAPRSWGWSVDSQGGIWQATDRDGVRYFPCEGLTAQGVPRYSYANMQSFPMPPEFTELCRAEYLPQTDTIFLAGYTKDHPHVGGEWGAVGTEALRYDGWTKGSSAPSLRIMLPNDGTKEAKLFIKAMCVAGDYLFAAELRNPERVFAYSIHTGEFIGTMQPGPAVGGSSGWIDTPYGIRALKRLNGEYEIFVEEDLDAKVILYRWTPRVCIKKVIIRKNRKI